MYLNKQNQNILHIQNASSSISNSKHELHELKKTPARQQASSTAKHKLYRLKNNQLALKKNPENNTRQEEKLQQQFR
jgi:hypothetical protein